MQGWNTQSRFSVYKVPDGFLNTSAAKRRLLLWTTTPHFYFSPSVPHVRHSSANVWPQSWKTKDVVWIVRTKTILTLRETQQHWGLSAELHSYSFIFALVVWCAYRCLDIFCILWKKVTQSTYLKYIYFILSMVKIYSYIYWHIAGNLLI